MQYMPSLLGLMLFVCSTFRNSHHLIASSFTSRTVVVLPLERRGIRSYRCRPSSSLLHVNISSQSLSHVKTERILSSSSRSDSASSSSSVEDCQDFYNASDHDEISSSTFSPLDIDIDVNLPYFPIFYNDVYEVPLPPKHRFPMEKYRKVRNQIQSTLQSFPTNYASKVQCHFQVSPLVSIQNLTTTHCPDYVQRYMDGNQTEQEIRNVGFPWSIKGVKRSLSSTGGTVAAAVSMCQAKRMQHQLQQAKATDEGEHSKRKLEDMKGKPMIWGAHVAGGTHHAFRDRGEGFCVFSDIAVAANVILRDYPDVVRKILIIDLDVHQGNGNSVLFQDRDEVKTFSMHCSSNYFSKKETSDLDIELPPGCNDATYLATLHHWLKRMTQEMKDDVDFIFFQAGVDILDEDRLGRLDISYDGIERRNEMVYQFASEMGCPLCITMGGGYPKKSWEPILNAHANVYIQAFRYLADNH